MGLSTRGELFVDRREDSSWQLFLAVALWMMSVLVPLGTVLAWAHKDGLGPNHEEILESLG